MPSHYDRLGVEPGATHEEIKRAYHRQARLYHPDTRPGAEPAAAEQARRVMAAVNAAWAVLGDPARRRAYDAEIGAAARPRASAPPPPVEADDDAVWFGDEDENVERGPADLVVLVPVALAVLAVATFAFSVLIQSPFWMWVSIVLLPVAGAAFVATPLVVMLTRARGRAQPRD